MSLFKFNAAAKKELLERVISHVQLAYQNTPENIREEVLEEMIYWEKKRLEKMRHSWWRSPRLDFWEQYQQQYVVAPREVRHRLLEQSIDHYAHQIVGNFSPWVHTLATKVVPPFLNFLLNPFSFQKLISLRSTLINENLIISGNIANIKALLQRGTLVFVPTHVSNLDSILLGTALHDCDFPPAMYGAGLNLFRNKIIGFFMNHLGAYKVDRQRVHTLYKDVLKEYATSSLEMGFHNLFFPGGTRSRSGAIEKRLKLGLLGTTLAAYVRNLIHGKRNPNLYVIPVNINCHLTLEAETLIHDFLAVTGKSRYIIENDEFSKPQRVYTYLKNHMNLNSKSFIHFGDPLDPFGNRVDETGCSLDRHGRKIDISKYVMAQGEVKLDFDRDQNYTKELATTLIDVYHRHNRVLSTNLVAFALYEMIALRHPDFDIYRLMRSRVYHEPIELMAFYKMLDRVVSHVRALSEQGKIVYSQYLKSLDTQDLVSEALKFFGSYHARRTVYREGDRIFVGDLLLLYYYHNRLVGYNLEDELKDVSL